MMEYLLWLSWIICLFVCSGEHSVYIISALTTWWLVCKKCAKDLFVLVHPADFLLLCEIRVTNLGRESFLLASVSKLKSLHADLLTVWVVHPRIVPI
ncbi:unnamed protein product [Cylicocyclus nassatus]|uniref:Secreted protein n=1 Tax=Cylicocyclus nassatus TaxID=53992 RepID=A0AA36DRH0_CYLNA|nr:unnamed protein product [Cylicocyclus nassatus]